MKNIVFLVLLFVIGCGGDDGGSDKGTREVPGGPIEEVPPSPVTTLRPELRLLGPENGSRIKNSVSASLECTSGINVEITGDTSLDSQPCINGILTKTISLNSGEGPKSIVFKQQVNADHSTLVLSLYNDTTNPVCSFNSAFSYSNSTPLTIEFSCTDNDQVHSIQCSIDGGSYNDCSAGNIVLSTISEGDHNLSIRAYDSAQNISQLQVKNFHHDTTSPDISILSQPSATTNSTSAEFNFNTSDSGSLVALTECQLDSQNWETCASPLSFADLSNGMHNLKIRSTDHSGNIGNAQYSWEIDLTPPNDYSISGVSGGADVVSDAFLISGNNALISWSDSSSESNYFISILNGDGSTEICPEVALPANTTQYGFNDCLLASGSSYKAKLYAKDSLLNVGPSQYFNFLVTGWHSLTWPEATSIYGAINPGQVIERVFTISYSGDVAIQNLSGIISGSAFTFKGGSFPGVGGTCISGVTSDCTIIINYAPQAPGSHSANVQLSFTNGFQTQTRTIALEGTANLPPPAKIKFNIGSGVVSGDCVAVQLLAQTNEGVNSNVSSNASINLTVNNGAGAFYDSSSCSTTTTSATILSGTYDVVTYFKSLTPNQNLTLVATATGLAGATHYINIGSTPTALVISGVNQALISSCVAYSVDRIDGNGFKVSALNSQNVTISQSGSAQIFSDSNCSNTQSSFTIGANQSGTSFYIRNGQAENLVLSAVGSGLTTDTHNLSFQTALSWWNAAWTKRVRINISNLDQSESFSNIPILLRLNSSNINYSLIQSQGQDLRLVGSDDTTVLSHEIELWNPSGESLVWVKIPSIAASSADGFIYLYFGNSSAANGENKSSVWTSYSAVWHLQESPTSPGPQFKNAVGGTFHGTAENSPTSSPAIIGNGLNLNGNFDGFDVGSNLANIIGSSSTFTLWMKSNQVGNNTNWQAPGITGVEQAGGVNDIFFGWMDGGGKIAITAGDAAAAKSNFVVNDNNWRHVSMTRDHLTGTAKFFVNGVFNASSNTGVGAKTTPFQKIGVIGDTGGTPTEFDGYIDELRLYNSVQSDARIKADFKYQNGTHLSYSLVEDKP
jgi:hypothetical protein